MEIYLLESQLIVHSRLYPHTDLTVVGYHVNSYPEVCKGHNTRP